MATTCSLDQLAEEKEQELLLIRQQQTQAVQEALKGAQNELLLERQRLSQLQADFDYNLKLLSQRDEELAHYENAFAELKRVINNLLAENSELKVRVDGLHTEVEQGRLSQQQLKEHYVKRIEQLHSQTEAYRRVTQSEMEKERSKLEQLQGRLEQRLLEVEGDIQCQRESISTEFDELSRQREHEHQMKVSELNSQLLSKESQVRQLERELKVAQTARASSEEQTKDRESEVARMDRQARELQWKMDDATNLLENRVAELQTQLEQTQAMARTHQEDFQRRHEDLDHKVREKEACIKAAKEAFSKRESELERQLTEARSHLESREAEIRRLLWEREDALKEKDLHIQKCQEDLASCQTASDDRVRDMSQELVARDLKLKTLEDMCERLREDVRRRDSDIEHFKKELGAGLTREKTLEQSKAQLQLDWEGRMEEVERRAYGKHQSIIGQLTEAKDKLSSECGDLRTSLEEQKTQMMAVLHERDIAIATLSKHGLASHVTDHVTQLQQLRQQNEELKGVIRQMRHELEQLAQVSEARNPSPSGQGGHAQPTSGYVQYMEKELAKIKAENRRLVERLQQTPPTGKPPSTGRRSPSPPRSSNSVGSGERKQHRSHLIALSDMIASLQKEKGSLELAVVQLRSRVEELEANLSKEQEQVYLLKACQVPQSKLHLKLLQATKVIIALVNDKKQLTARLKEMADAERRTKSQQSDPKVSQTPVQLHFEKGVQTSSSPRGHVQWTVHKTATDSSTCSSVEQRPPTGALSGHVHSQVQHVQHGQLPVDSVGSSHNHPATQAVPGLHHQHVTSSVDPPLLTGKEDDTRSSQCVQEAPRNGQQVLDMSLASLRFTDSSLGESSLHHVLQMVERGLSSSDNDRDAPVGHSTPERAVETSSSRDHQPPQLRGESDERPLKLVGSRVVPQAKKHGRPQTTSQTSRTRKQTKSTVKPKVRNYNIRD